MDSPSDKLAHAADCGIDLGVVAQLATLLIGNSINTSAVCKRASARGADWIRRDQKYPMPCGRTNVQLRHAQPAAVQRIDGAQAVAGPHSQSRVRRSSRLGWTMLGLGLMAFTCGTCLLIGSWIEERPELWSLGVPIAIGGQIGLFVGLVLQLERIWQSSRQAVLQLEQVDAQLRQLERATAGWSAHQGTATQAFGNLTNSPGLGHTLTDFQAQLD